MSLALIGSENGVQMRHSPAQHVACNSSSNSTRCLHLHAVSVKPLLHSRTAAAAANLNLGPYQHAVAASSSAWQSSSSGSAGSVRSAGVICRDAPRPMWARKSPPLEASKQTGTELERLITKQISAADSIVDLEDVFNEWGGSFNHIHASAAIVKCSKLREGAHSPVLLKLSSSWLTQLPASDMQGCANVLWACTRLSSPKAGPPQFWDPTWAAFVQQVAQSVASQSAVVAQNVSNPLWACAKLRQQPPAGELQLLVQAFLRSDVLAAANAQGVSNLVWGIGKLCQLPGWQGGVSEQDVQQLLGKEQLQLVADSDYKQHSTSVLVALVGLSAGDTPLISTEFAQDCAAQLLGPGTGQISKWTPQDITNAMWACSELGLSDLQFTTAAVKAAPTWLPGSTGYNLTQAATACAQLQYRDEAFLGVLLQQGFLLLQQKHTRQYGQSRALSENDKASLVALCGMAIAKLDMRSLAKDSRDLVALSGIGSWRHAHPANLRHLWVFHSWLLQHQLLDGKGLTGVLTQQQLQVGEKEAALYGDGFKGTPVL